jgi:hypothetical protein
MQAAQAQIYGPKMLIQEEVTCNYWPNGTEKSGLARTGSIYVSTPNNDDVLQYIRLNTSSGFDTYTNLQNPSAYQDVIVSYPAYDDWELMYVNTTTSDSDTSYTITDEAPTINFSMEFKNSNGGIDLYDDFNIYQYWNDYYLNVTMTNPHSTRNLASVSVSIWFDRDTNGANDAVNIYSDPTADSGTPGRANTDGGDSHFDVATWTGTLNAGSSVNLTIRLNMTQNIHFTADSLNLDDNGEAEFTADQGGTSTWGASGTLFSAITVNDKFSRGPVRQGVDLSSNAGTWYVRGFIRNMGTSSPGAGEQPLTFNVTDWAIHEVDPNGVPYTAANQTGEFNESGGPNIDPDDGRIYTNNGSRSSNTSLYNTTSGSKPYISVYFNWEVLWNSSNSENNITYINTTLDLPELYLLDLTQSKSIAGTVSPEVGGENLTINDTLINVGSNETEPSLVMIESYVPANTTGGNWRGSGWDIEDAADIEVYLNGTYQITPDGSNCVVTVTDPTQSSDGVVNLSIANLAGCDLTAGGTVGHTFDENDNVTITYVATSDSEMTTGDSYSFYGIGTLNSSTNTQDREYNLANQTVSVSGLRLTGYKDLIATDPQIPTLINTSINVTVEDSAGTGISGIKFMDFIPANTDIGYNEYVGNVTVLFYNASGLFTWVKDQDYNITDNGTTTLVDGLEVQMYEFVNTSGDGTWNLTDKDFIYVTYQLNYTQPGVYVLPVMIAAFDPQTGASLAATFYGVIKVVVPEPSLALSIDEGDLRISQTVLVGKPAVWTKDFSVFNPNARTIPATFQTTVFKDASDGYVRYFDENGRLVEEGVIFARDSSGERVMQWQSTLLPLETRNYEVTVLTPPVLEIDRDIEVLEQLPEKKVRLKMDVYLKSFAEENYENVILNLPIAYLKVEEVRDGFGNRLPFTGGPESTSITVDRMSSGELKTVTIIYKESYPTIIITPDRDRYNLNSPVSLEILVINGGERIEYPYLEIEIYTPGMDVVFTNIERLEEMDPLEKTSMYEKFVIPASAPAGMYVASARFREDFAVLASATGNFYVLGVSGGLPEALEIFMIVMVSAILIYFSLKRLREVRGSRRPGTYGGI